jgi:hypothetical protein
VYDVQESLLVRRQGSQAQLAAQMRLTLTERHLVPAFGRHPGRFQARRAATYNHYAATFRGGSDLRLELAAGERIEHATSPMTFAQLGEAALMTRGAEQDGFFISGFSLPHPIGVGQKRTAQTD